MNSDLLVGNWREGLSDNGRGIVEDVEKREKVGFRLFPQETAMLELISYLEGYDTYAEAINEGD